MSNEMLKSMQADTITDEITDLTEQHNQQVILTNVYTLQHNGKNKQLSNNNYITTDFHRMLPYCQQKQFDVIQQRVT